MILEEIRTLLDAPPTGEDAPTLENIENTLTAGYARALELEAERRRIERRLSEMASASGLSGSTTGHSEIATLGRRLTEADDDLTMLRDLLVSLRTRADEVRTV